VGVDLLEQGGKIVLVCNTTDVAFGPVFELPDELRYRFINGNVEYVETFLRWLPQDVRSYSNDDLPQLKARFDAECIAESKAALGLDKPTPPPSVWQHCQQCGAMFDAIVICPACADSLQPLTTPPVIGPARSP